MPASPRKRTSREINKWLNLEWHKHTAAETLNTIYVAESAVYPGHRYYVERGVRRDVAVFLVWADPIIGLISSDIPGRYEAQSYAQRHETKIIEKANEP